MASVKSVVEFSLHPFVSGLVTAAPRRVICEHSPCSSAKIRAIRGRSPITPPCFVKFTAPLRGLGVVRKNDYDDEHEHEIKNEDEGISTNMRTTVGGLNVAAS